MTFTSLPTRGIGDLQPAISDVRAPVTNELSADSIEAIKDRIIQIGTAVGLDDGSTVGSLRAAVAAIPAVGSGIVATGRAISNGASTTAARVDHVHDHGRCEDDLCSGAHSTPFSLLGTMDLVSVATTSGKQKIALPNASSLGAGAAAKGRYWIIQKVSGDVNEIQLLQDTDGGNIQGSAVATYDIMGSSNTNYPGWIVRRRSDGSWWILPMNWP